VSSSSGRSKGVRSNSGSVSAQRTHTAEDARFHVPHCGQNT
jgi:hypothetical protein